MNEVLEETMRLWREAPTLTEMQGRACETWEALLFQDNDFRKLESSRGAYGIMQLVGSNIADSRWSRECALSCYRISKRIKELSNEEYMILEELYSKLTRHRNKKEIASIITFWKRLDDYRAEQQTSANWEGNQLVDNFKKYKFYHDLADNHDLSNYNPQALRSFINKEFHKKVGWKHAAVAIMENGLPKLQQLDEPNDVTASIKVLGKFASELAAWLKNFATRMHNYRNTDKYKIDNQNSNSAREARVRRQINDKSKDKSNGKGKGKRQYHEEYDNGQRKETPGIKKQRNC